MPAYRIEIREPGKDARQVEVADSVDVGREGEGVVLDDPKVSRRHLRLTVRTNGLLVTDLGSTNGTRLNGTRITGEANFGPGDVIRVGAVEIIALPPVSERRDSDLKPDVQTQAVPPNQLWDVRPALDEMYAIESDAATIRYVPGSPGESAAPGMAAAVRRARRRLSGLGSEPWGAHPQICLADPFPDPGHPGLMMTSGTWVDSGSGEIWMVVTAESPPEPPERALALLFGSALPAASELALLLEGYGLYLSGAQDPDAELREMELPPLGEGEGELTSAMALSFVGYLIDRGGIEDFRRLLVEARPGKLDAAAQELYGAGMSALEDAWRAKLAAGPPDVKLGQFLRLAAKYLRPHTRREAEMFIYMLLGLGFTIVFPFAFKRLIDVAIPSGRFSEVLGLLGLLGVAFVVSLVAGLRRAYLAAYVSAGVVREIRTTMFGRMQAQSASWFSKRQQGDVLSRLFSDVGALEAGLSQTLREGLFQLLSLIASAAVLIILNPLLAVIVLLGAPAIGAVYKSMAKEAQKRSMTVQERVGGVLTIAAENFGAQPVIKAFALEARERSRFARSSDRLFKAQLKLQLFGGLFGLSVNMIVTALRMGVLALGGWLILQRQLTVGGLVAFMGIMGEVLNPVTVLTGIGQQIQAATGALVRINDVLETEPEVRDDENATALPPLAHEIRLDGIGFSYAPERRTLESIDAVIPAGSRVAFVGPTGAGKSSILQLIMRFYDPDEGAVRFDGTDLRSVTVASLRAQLGIVFQETFLFDATIKENIAVGKPGASDGEIESAARVAELHEFIVTLPRGYDTLVGERGGRLSGGQRQRLSLARALLRDPRVLLLDEATSALDPRTEQLIATTLERVGKGRTTIAVTHRLGSVTGYDRIFVIVSGRLVEQGTHEELLRLKGTYADLWAEQAGGAAAEDVFDPKTGLRRVHLFSHLSERELEAAASRLRSLELAAGQRFSEGGGRLAIVGRGRADVLAPGLSGAMVIVGSLGPGDAFGISAILGQETGVVMEASGPVSLLVLDQQALDSIASEMPAVAAALMGAKPVVEAAPAGGRRLSRLTLTPEQAAAPPLADSESVEREIRRSSGRFSLVFRP